ncbi:MAG TPA: SIS domain-containing protein [Acidimicrobiales bacterium]|nr:SIS domain-containing protein [Acidimicrobiales bacterium]
MQPTPDPSVTDLIWAELYERHPTIRRREEQIFEAWQLLRNVLYSDHRVLVCGNGGSASDSEHIAGEMAKPCALARPLSAERQAALRAAGDDGYLAQHLQDGFAVIPLVSQAALITAIANDQAGDLIFAQQVMAYGSADDLLWALSTSGNSPNVIHALRTAKALGMHTLGLSGPTGGAMATLCDAIVQLPGQTVPDVQHNHQLVYHALCLAIEAERYGPGAPPAGHTPQQESTASQGSETRTP